jgi:hypothetical protein
MSPQIELLTEEFDRYGAECRRLAGLSRGSSRMVRPRDDIMAPRRFRQLLSAVWARNVVPLIAERSVGDASLAHR